MVSYFHTNPYEFVWKYGAPNSSDKKHRFPEEITPFGGVIISFSDTSSRLYYESRIKPY